jgi:hypothetical protein
MSEVVMDSKRRIVLPKAVEERHGEKFIVLNLLDEVVLKPVPKDPLKAAQEEWSKKMKGVGYKQLRREFEEELLKRSKKK